MRAHASVRGGVLNDVELQLPDVLLKRQEHLRGATALQGQLRRSTGPVERRRVVIETGALPIVVKRRAVYGRATC